MSALLQIEGLTIQYAGTARPVIDDLTLDVMEREILCVVGESGSGKTTLALACLRLLGDGVRVDGSITLAGRNLLQMRKRELRSVRGREVGFVYQDALSMFSPLWTVGEQISETIRAHEPCSRRDAWSRAVEQLAQVKVRDPARISGSYPHELSGGQRQRAALAMALVLRPRVLIADEPTSALDVTTGAHLLALLRQLQEELSFTVLLITHDMGVVQAVADRIAVMYAGTIGELGPRDEVLQRPRFPYTRALTHSLALDRPRGTLMGIPGSPPGLSAEVQGCPFAPRCPRAEVVCTVDAPAPRVLDGVVVRCHFPLTSVPKATGAEAHR